MSCVKTGRKDGAARKGFQVGPKLLAFIVAILALVVLLIVVGQELILETVPNVVDQLIDAVLGGLG